MGQSIYPVRTPVPVFFVIDEVFLTQIAADTYVPLAQTSITSAYANEAQATYARRCDTDVVVLTQINADAYVPLAQTSIASAYANGAQATYRRR